MVLSSLGSVIVCGISAGAVKRQVHSWRSILGGSWGLVAGAIHKVTIPIEWHPN